jgi:hypothetical protein
MFRPEADLSYEHMFPRTNTPPLARRLLNALRLIRSFLLLEDDYDVDWEVDWDEPYSHQPSPHRTAREGPSDDHPHRVALRSRLGSRRPGAPAPREQVCLCPLPPVALRYERGRGTVVASNGHEPPRGAARVL